MPNNNDLATLQQLISALRAETQENSISPENVGYIFQNVLSILTDHDSYSTNISALEEFVNLINNKEFVSSLGLSSVRGETLLSLTARIRKFGSALSTIADITIPLATATTAGIMSAAQFNKLEAKGGFYRAIFETMPNVHYNEQTNFYEVWKNYGGLSDVTEQQMIQIYLASTAAIYSQCMLEGFDTRAVVPLGSINGTAMYNRAIFYWCPNLEFVAFTTQETYEQTIKGKVEFAGCSKLRKVFTPVKISNDIDKLAFKGCSSLVDVSINIASDVNLSDCPLLSFYSIKYITLYPHNNNLPVMVTLHPHVYSMLMGGGTPAEYEASGHTQQEWSELVTVASGKKISFLNPEELNITE